MLVGTRILWNDMLMERQAPKMRRAEDQKLLDECAYFDLRRASRALSRFYDDFMRDTPIKGTQFSFLRMIMIEKELTLTTLGRYMAMDRTSVTRALDPLIRDKFVKIRKSDDDGRVRYVSLTKKGRDAVVHAEPYWRKAQEALLEAIGAARWQSMRTVLRETTSKVRHVNDGVVHH